jgi:hypothetical protein
VSGESVIASAAEPILTPSRCLSSNIKLPYFCNGSKAKMCACGEYLNKETKQNWKCDTLKVRVLAHTSFLTKPNPYVTGCWEYSDPRGMK